ncbi:sugar ABC transporter permease [candidate division KSB3 bacterium]|uniref:Sugar ABC transporter permease n=1 Tax=candidate division KSB3 bacterium TaxID=2044937 RepID=A0A2G6E2I5_9BACT|nr:MAG: sugar ABC transporter permease [candidate division KSB3 bacterium]PIE28847.1 MAG: sugar ABC transporter permease [candidate division KSB3 bacterium]
MSTNNIFRKWFQNNPDLAILPFLGLGVTVFMILLTGGQFLTGINLRSMAFQLPELGLFSLAMMPSLLTNGINLSIVSSANLTGVIMAVILTSWASPETSGLRAGVVILAAICIGLLVAVLSGAINGLLIAYVGVSPVLTTLGTMIFYEGLTTAITRGYVISKFPAAFLTIGNGTLTGIPISLILLGGCALLMAVILEYTPFGLRLRMLGSNVIAAEFSCIDVKKALLSTYMLSGVLSGLAGIVMISRFNSANVGYGASYLLLTILICVLGGVSPTGGFGKVGGVVLALLILQFLSSGLNLLGMSSFITIAFWGITLVLVIAYRFFTLRKFQR